MARSTTEIQADIALTRQLIERRLEALHRRVPDTWWMPWAMLGGALVVGLVLARLPVLRVVGTGAKTIRTGVQVAGTLAAVDRFLAERRTAPTAVDRAA